MALRQRQLIFSLSYLIGFTGLTGLSWILPNKTMPAWVSMVTGISSPRFPLSAGVAYGLYLVFAILLWGCYLKLVFRESRYFPETWGILLLAAIIGILGSTPAFSHDMLVYLSEGRISSVWGQNPYTHLPSQFFQDPIIALNTDWPNTYPNYGPLWISLSIGLSWIGRSSAWLSLVLFKVLSFSALWAGAWFTADMAHHWRGINKAKAFAFVALNPLLMLETALSGHNDSVMMVLFVMALWLHTKGKSNWAWLFLVGSVYIKYTILPVAGLFAVYVLWKKGWRSWVWGAVIALLASVVLFFPYWEGGEALRGLQAGTTVYGSITIAGLVKSVVGWVIQRFFPGLEPQVAMLTQILVLLPAAGLLLIFALRQRKNFLQFVRNSILVLIVMVIFTTYIRNWYFLWPAAIAGIIAFTPLSYISNWFCLGAGLYYMSNMLPEATWYKGLVMVICFAWPGWLLLRYLFQELLHPEPLTSSLEEI